MTGVYNNTKTRNEQNDEHSKSLSSTYVVWTALCGEHLKVALYCVEDDGSGEVVLGHEHVDGDVSDSWLVVGLLCVDHEPHPPPLGTLCQLLHPLNHHLCILHVPVIHCRKQLYSWCDVGKKNKLYRSLFTLHTRDDANEKCIPVPYLLFLEYLIELSARLELMVPLKHAQLPAQRNTAVNLEPIPPPHKLQACVRGQHAIYPFLSASSSLNNLSVSDCFRPT